MRFIRRVAMVHSVGSIVKFNNRYISLPLYRNRPPLPFRPRFSERVDVEKMMERLMGEAHCWRPHSRGRVSSDSILKRIRIRDELTGYRKGKHADFAIANRS